MKAWSIVGDDTCNAILHFFDTGNLPRMVNSSAIVLVPKHPNADHLSQYRPISCCNTIYKCITKLLAFRMSRVMHYIISSNQTAFVPTRKLGDNIFLAQALCRDYHLNRGPPRFACKVDIKKAFDTVSWSFILTALEKMNFPAQFIHWIKICITTCFHSVKVNGGLEGYFGASAGLRQGDPISPYLFVIAMECLNLCISKYTRDTNFSYHWRCSKVQLTHLVFADDLMLFCKGDEYSIRLLFQGVNLFSRISGLKPNHGKSQCFFGNVDDGIRTFATTLTGFNVGSLPINYLGLPLVSRTLRKRDCQPLVLKICKRLEVWSNKYISQAGRLQLITAILQNISGFWSAHVFLPLPVIKKVQSMLAQFIWAGNLSSRCVHKVSWQDCAFPKDEGGLGVKNLAIWNDSAILFQLWRVVTHEDSLWISWLYMYELRDKGFWTMNIPAKCSWTWKKILQLRNLALRFISYSPGEQSRFLLWHDPWLQGKPLLQVFDSSIVSALESTSLASVGSIQSEGGWHLGVSNYNLIRELRHMCSNILTSGEDCITWTSAGNQLRVLKISNIYRDLFVHRPGPPWIEFVWSKFRVPKFAFTSWLILKERLLTRDRMIMFGMPTPQQCLLCMSHNETHSHLFCTCSYTKDVFRGCCVDIATWGDFGDGRFLSQCYDQIHTHVLYLIISAVFYNIWAERNLRLHNPGQYKLPNQLIDIIKVAVRMRLHSCNYFQKKALHDPNILRYLF